MIEIGYLGHIISASGVATDPKKILDVVNWHVPNSVTKLRGFLGLTGYYRRFVRGYGRICKPLFDILKKDSFIWGEPQLIAFETLKRAMTTCPVLALPDFSKPFILETDACGTGLGAVLMQGNRPIAYYSKTLGLRAAAQSIYEKEAMAILEALKKWRHYLLGNQLVIKTDQRSLKFITTQRLVEGIQHKLLLKLLEFDYKVEYKKGKENLVADALSRRDVKDLGSIENCHAIVTVIPEWVEDVKGSYVNDSLYEKVVTNNQMVAGDVNGYTLESGLLRYKGRIYVGIGNDNRAKILDSFHSSSMGDHSGMRATYHRLMGLFYWPKLKRSVELLVTECPTCQLTKSEHIHSPGLLNPLEVPDMAWSHISMDFIEGLPKSRGKEVILVVVDRFTKYAHFLSLSHPYSVQQVVQTFMDNIFKLHGMPIAIVTDRDRVFTSHLFQEIFIMMKVSLRLSSVYHPQTDGQTERVNQCLESYLRSMTFQEPREWMSWLTLAE